ncbi:MAG: ComF family protein [bacterium]|nr:ComF family protein [bacterium]
MHKIINYVINVVFPLKCEVCQRQLPLKAQARICPGCLGRILIIGDHYCLKCGKSMQVDTSFCADCHDHDALYYDTIRAAGIYQGILREAIQAFKYNRRSCLGTELGELMFKSYQRYFSQFTIDTMIPIPLHKKQSHKRQYNQSEILAVNLGKAAGIPVFPKTLSRIKETRPQYALNKRERADNIRNAFQIRKGANLPGAKVLVIDDICTTGSTINECARVLKQAGATEVHGLVLAHG